MRLVQLQNGIDRCVALVEEPHLQMVDDFDSVFSLANAAVDRGVSLTAMVMDNLGDHRFDYDSIYAGESKWRLMVPIDHPEGPSRTLVSGTGLTHLGSAINRQAMHADTVENMTDSMKMFRWGVEGGRPAEGQAGIAPEWFYKGSGAVFRARRATGCSLLRRRRRRGSGDCGDLSDRSQWNAQSHRYGRWQRIRRSPIRKTKLS